MFRLLTYLVNFYCVRFLALFAYAPAGSTTQTPTFTHLATVYYEKRSLDRLTAMFRFYQVCEPHPIPQGNGKTIQMNRFILPGFNTTPAAEGVIGNPVQQASQIVTATVEQYSDFMSTSALLNETNIVNTVDQMSDDLSYRAAGTTDTIIRTEIDSNTSALQATIGAFLTAADFKKAVALLTGINVRPDLTTTTSRSSTLTLSTIWSPITQRVDSLTR